MYGMNLSASIKKVPSSQSHITLFTSHYYNGHTFTHPDPMWWAELRELNYVMFSGCHGNVLCTNLYSSKGFLQRTGNIIPLYSTSQNYSYAWLRGVSTATGRECQQTFSCEHTLV